MWLLTKWGNNHLGTLEGRKPGKVSKNWSYYFISLLVLLLLWVIDPTRPLCDQVNPGTQCPQSFQLELGSCWTPLLDPLRLHVSILWQLPHSMNGSGAIKSIKSICNHGQRKCCGTIEGKKPWRSELLYYKWDTFHPHQCNGNVAGAPLPAFEGPRG